MSEPLFWGVFLVWFSKILREQEIFDRRKRDEIHFFFLFLVVFFLFSIHNHVSYDEHEWIFRNYFRQNILEKKENNKTISPILKGSHYQFNAFSRPSMCETLLLPHSCQQKQQAVKVGTWCWEQNGNRKIDGVQNSSVGEGERIESTKFNSGVNPGQRSEKWKRWGLGKYRNTQKNRIFG